MDSADIAAIAIAIVTAVSAVAVAWFQYGKRRASSGEGNRSSDSKPTQSFSVGGNVGGSVVGGDQSSSNHDQSDVQRDG